MEEYFKNKRVVVIGPANYLSLITKETKENIKNSDTIVRINRGFDLVEQYSSIVGKKTDVLYNNLLGDCINGGVLDPKKIASAEVKHIRTVPKSDIKGIAISNTTNIKNKETYMSLLDLQKNHKINTSIIDCNMFSNAARKVDCRPTTGFVALLDILSYLPTNLHVTGYSFYLGGVLKGYFGGKSPGGIFKTFGRSEDEEIERNFNSTRHVHANMWNYCKESFLTLENISFDPILTNILEMDSFSKEKYQKIIVNYSKSE